LVAGVHLELCVVAPRETVVAAVRAAAERGERPGERDTHDALQSRAARDFLVVGAGGEMLRIDQSRRPTFFNGVGDISSRGRPPAKDKELWHLRCLFATDDARVTTVVSSRRRRTVPPELEQII